MLHLETIQHETLDLLKNIQSNPYFATTRLVGGTALALQIGHRKSIDLDLFGSFRMNPIELHQQLMQYGTLQVRNAGTSIHQFSLNQILLDLVQYDYPWLNDPLREGGVTLATIPDIAAMKLAAITNRGTKKDFIDIAFILRQFTLSQILDFYQQKFIDGSTFLVIKSLVYFEDAEDDPMPHMLLPMTWEKTRKAITTAVQQFCR